MLVVFTLHQVWPLYFDPFPAFDHNALLVDARAEAQT